MARLSMSRGLAVRLGAMVAGIGLVTACSGSSGASWTPVSGFPDAAGSTLNGVTAGPASFVAVGQAPASGESNHAAAWTSADGKVWTRATDDPSFSLHFMTAVASGPQGFMAVGGSCANGECFNAAVWASSDGSSWHPTPPLPVGSGGTAVSRTVVASGSAWFVGGYTNEAADAQPPSIWATADGSSWTEATVELSPGDVGEQAVVAGIVVAGGTDVAVGSVKSDEGRAAAAWSSTDGKDWKPATEDVSFPGSLMSAVAAGGPGFVAVGRDGSGAAVWDSKDGTTWKEEPAGPGFAGAQMLSISFKGGRFVAVGYDPNTALIWTSADGLSWTQASSASDMAGAQALSVAVGASVDVAVGATPGTANTWTASH